jgi:hypothetical protein
VDNSPLLHKLKKIDVVQSAMKKPNYIQKMSIIEPLKDTIPVVLYLKSGKLFYSYGNIGQMKGSECFSTPFFRIEHINNQVATFSLLKPIYEPMKLNKDICDVSKVEKTSCCIDIHIEIIGGIQFLSPYLVL